jgi:hypothetical protein
MRTTRAKTPRARSRGPSTSLQEQKQAKAALLEAMESLKGEILALVPGSDDATEFFHLLPERLDTLLPKQKQAYLFICEVLKAVWHKQQGGIQLTN